MEKTITYRKRGDYLIPDLVPPEDPQIGIWGLRRKRFLQQHRDPIYTGLLLSGKLKDHLEEIDQQAEAMLQQIMRQMIKAEGITELDKANDQINWAQRMNSVQTRAEEIVLIDLTQINRKSLFRQHET